MSEIDDSLLKGILLDPDQALKTIAKHESRNSLLAFTQYTKHNYVVNWHHKLICDELDSFLADPNRKRLMVFVGPRRGKSEIISRRFPAYAFGKNPDLEIMSASYAADLAQAMSRDCQRIIDSPEYRELFPDTQLSGKNVVTSAHHNYVRTSDMFEIVGHEGKYNCAGVNGPLTGKGADIFLIDDPIKGPEDASSTKMKDKVYDWYQAVAGTRLSPQGKVIIVLTRWAEDDLAGRLLKDAEADPEAHQWDVISLPEMFTADHKYLHDADKRKDGDVLWPSRFPQDVMEQNKKSMPLKVWESLFQQEPSPGSGIIFNPDWLRYYKTMPEFDYKVASWDLSFKDGKSTDFVVGTVWGVKGVDKYLIWAVRERMSFVETIKQMLIVNNRFPDLRFTIVEDKANGPAVISTLKSKIKGLVPFTPKGSKESRASSVSPQVEAGNVWLPDKYSEELRQEMPWVTTLLDILIEELKGFPFTKNDDFVDTLTQMLIKLGNGGNWFDELMAGNGVDAKTVVDPVTDKRNNAIADMMGWDIDVEPTETGFSFDLGF